MLAIPREGIFYHGGYQLQPGYVSQILYGRRVSK
jgi:hypothetical protein